MNQTFDTSQFTALAQYWDRAPDITREEMLIAITDCDLLVQGELQQNLPSGAGGAAGLIGSIQREETALADTVLGTVSTDREHALYVELGTRPHMPPLMPLLDWVRAKLGLVDEEAESAARAIQWKISHHGTKANPVWAQTFTRLQGALAAKIDAGLVRIARRLAALPS